MICILLLLLPSFSFRCFPSDFRILGTSVLRLFRFFTIIISSPFGLLIRKVSLSFNLRPHFWGFFKMIFILKAINMPHWWRLFQDSKVPTILCGLYLMLFYCTEKYCSAQNIYLDTIVSPLGNESTQIHQIINIKRWFDSQ